MQPALQLALLLAILLPTCKIAASLFSRLGIPPILGELLVGVVLGPGAINLLHLRLFDGGQATGALMLLAQLGGLVLMFVAGIETDIDCAPTGIPLHNLLGKISHSSVHPGTLGNSVSTKTLSIDFILIDHDGTIEGEPPTRASKIAGTGIGPIFLNFRRQHSPPRNGPPLHGRCLTQRAEDKHKHHQSESTTYKRK